MALSLAIDDITPDKVTRKIVPGGPGLITTTFFRAAADTLNAPTVFLVRQDPEFFNGIHYHAADEFQIVIEGKGKFGRHEISPYYLHFARAYTPYGPLLPDRESGWSFVTLRARYDPGAQHLPAAREKLKQIPNRRPWQISKKICFPDAGSGAAVHAVEGMSDDQGLFAYTLSMAPATLFVAPEPSRGGGQFVVILKGSMVDDRERKALAVAFVKPEEKALEIRAGAEGLQGLILNLPKVNSAVAADAQRPAGVSGSRKWQCALCGFAYSEALGIPHDGIAPGTHWADVPDSWTCPDCGASKNDFEMVEA